MRFAISSVLLAVASVLPALSAAASNSSHIASFVYQSSAQDEFVFAMNVVQDTGDVYFHMSAPAGNAWMAVGFGDEMADAFMIVVYPNSTGTGVTISPRVAFHGEAEPSYYSAVTCEPINNSTIDPNANQVTTTGPEGLGGNIYADAVCRNAATWTNQDKSQTYSLSFTNTAQPLIFAVGPGESINSNALDAPMNRHAFYGQFSMDMTVATTKSTGSIPTANAGNGTYMLSNAAPAYATKKDNNYAQIAHGILGCLAFIIFFPSGALLLKMFNRVWLHTIVQSLGFFFVIIVGATGLNISPQYLRSMNYNSPHQGIGILVFVAVVIQWVIGFIGHILFKKGRPIPHLNKIHLTIGPLAMILGVVNGGIGITFALNTPYLEYYIIVAIAVLLVFVVVRGTIAFCNGRRAKKEQGHVDELQLHTTPLDAIQGPGGAYYEVGSAQAYPLTAYGQQIPAAYDSSPYGYQQQQQQYASQPVPPPAYAQQQQQQYYQQQQQQLQQLQQYFPPPTNAEHGPVEVIHVQPK